MKKIFHLVLILIISGMNFTFAQEVSRNKINPEILNKRWPAQWIYCKGTPSKQYGIYYFRKTFNVNSVPSSFIVNISADNRYRLYVNGESVCTGPARGDLQHWRFETIDIAKHLISGRNVLAAVVWNFGDYAPNSQMTHRTAFIMAGNSASEQMVNTNKTWKSTQDMSYEPITGFSQLLKAYYVVGPGERVTASKYIWGWQEKDFNDMNWKSAAVLNPGQPRKFGTNGDWMLVPRTIPLMEEKETRLEKLRASEGVKVPGGFSGGGHPFTVPPNTTAKILFDEGHLTKAYPVLEVSGGKNSEIKIGYAESLFNKDGSKGNRDEVVGKIFRGNYDIFIPDGNSGRIFSTLWFRTYRYLQLEIKTGNSPLTIEDLYGRFTAYPLQRNASFTSNDPDLEKIWDTGWWTARLCAAEIYYDCPYYEQMQYVGDTRIQSLISLYDAGDDRLMRNAIELFDNSRIPEGLTQSRYPAEAMQIIPPFSLYWVDMVHDYWMNRNDPEFVKSMIPGIESVLGWFQRHVASNGILGPLEWWNFVDWADEWAYSPERGYGGVPEGVYEGGSSIITLQFAYALQRAAAIENAFGNDYQANQYTQLAASLEKNVMVLCWDSHKGLLADTPERKIFSQHANIFGVLTGAFPDDREQAVLKRVLSDKSLIQCTLYFRFYLAQALKKAGMGNLYIDNLGPWKTMLERGLTTFAEKPDPTRSDCHAWSASPNYDFLATVCGIEPGSPGFKTVLIKPNPGILTTIEGTVPHPLGAIHVRYEVDGKKLIAEIELPEGLTGEISWNGRKYSLKPGKQTVNFN